LYFKKTLFIIIYLFYFLFNLKIKLISKLFNWGLGIGDWGLGNGDWGLGAIPNPQSPIPNFKFI